ncbi:FAD-binding oxidoreductase [Oceanicella actignis]|uniref:FAD/FMN-containing dehydrogenase n=1 Tax=Oceanicella actignis TaxID=1189325 RepID=A0A1M7SW95_9RHOB|nr:FAD-binding oxidoreductase [Oceanicella actignis]SES73616.1 FAD/FMN-containing dehydrogenase [Oceanicella actignis]SHN62721.1 FAD/FMN-containing dehydrogenase [Oceanicella actignis]
MNERRARLSGWGRRPIMECPVSAPRDEAELLARIARGPAVARGAGRAYGDAALSATGVILTSRLDRMLEFDPETGLLTAEAGVLLADVIDAFLPRGWFPAVTPGTRFVTLGGMIAADVHGKNHHVAGSFGRHVAWLDLAGPDGVTRCAPDRNPELFAATIGGMGLTGVILRAAFRMIPAPTGWIRTRTVAAPDLEAAMEAFEADADAPYSVAWIDCLARGAALGRSLVMFGAHAAPDEIGARPRLPAPRRRLAVPFDAPGWLLGRRSIGAFNAAYHALGARRAGEGLQSWESYFYPLDALGGWNRIYGRRGLVQFQCALPPDGARAGLRALLELTARRGPGAFLAVLKKFGPQEGGLLSFPRPGWTLALDFPASAEALALMPLLHAAAIDHGGRFYLAKDACLTAREFAASEPRADAFRALRARIGADRLFRSAQSERLGL